LKEAGDGILVGLRARGESGRFYNLTGPPMSRAVKRHITGDLAALKRLLESATDVV